MTWCADDKKFNFTIPKATPPGEYLLRAEQIFPWYWANETQFFISCAQVEIVGEGGGKYLVPTSSSAVTFFTSDFRSSDPDF